ncbi:MAG TPA: transcriptional regulator NrdR [Candidatus Saccharimonadales bacterium]|nr:transcriptional regulator NrdR [Candidatus Saccharimonadales bacterium]
MKCSRCKSDDTKVIESRDVTDGDAIRRRRECVVCQHRFTTYERVERPQIIVIKNNGTRELFDRSKLLAGLYRASEKTPVTSLQLERLVADIEQELQAQGESEVPSKTIGDMVMKQLANLNEVAYVRFASVYRRFKDIAGFERELLQIKERKSTAVKV